MMSRYIYILNIYKMYKTYLNAIETQLQITNPLDFNFKSNSNYTEILEHCNTSQGNQYLSEIVNRYNNLYTNNRELLINLCNKNDLYGKTIKSYINNFTVCSPSNLRYILHSFLILDYINQNNLNDIDFIEIGGGYGGLCFFISNLSSLFNIRIKSYAIFDLLQASLLQKKYLEALEINNIQYYQLDNFNNLYINSFLISNYAFSEISKELQIKYTNNILNPYTSYGFLTWNFIDVYDFIANSKITKEIEYPLSCNNNYYVKFSPLSLVN